MRQELATLARVVALAGLVTGAPAYADSGICGGVPVDLPFNDVQGNPFFCNIAAAFFSGLTNGTTATAYTPAAGVSREQMAAFISRTQEQGLRRGNRRAALGQWWTGARVEKVNTLIANSMEGVACDGTDVWATGESVGAIARYDGSGGRMKLLKHSAANAFAVVVAGNHVYAIGASTPGRLYSVDRETDADGPATLVADNLGDMPQGIAYDGSRIWTANVSGSVSIRTLVPLFATNTISSGFEAPVGILFDGTHIWVTDQGDDTLKKVDSAGKVVAQVAVGTTPTHPVFDGMNIWVPNHGADSVSVVRVKDASGAPLAAPFVVATLTGNGLGSPQMAAFDGQRVLVTSDADRISLWNAATLAPIANISTGEGSRPFAACSDGIHFWITLTGPGRLARY